MLCPAMPVLGWSLGNHFGIRYAMYLAMLARLSLFPSTQSMGQAADRVDGNSPNLV